MHCFLWYCVNRCQENITYGVQISTPQKIGSPLRGSWTMLRIVIILVKPPLSKKLDPPLILIIRPLRYPSIVTRRRCVAVVVSTCCSFVIIGLLEMEFAGDSFDIVRFREFGMCLMDSTDKDFLPITILNYTISIWAQAVIITVLYLIVVPNCLETLQRYCSTGRICIPDPKVLQSYQPVSINDFV